MAKRVFRLLVCLILVCCMIVNLSPIRAQAIVLEGYATVETVMLILAGLAALGVAKGASDAALDSLAHDIANSEEMAPYQTDGKTKITRLYPSDDNGTGPLWYIPFVILEIIKGLLWDSDKGVLSGPPVGTAFTVSFNGASHELTSSNCYITPAYALVGDYYYVGAIREHNGNASAAVFHNDIKVSSTILTGCSFHRCHSVSAADALTLSGFVFLGSFASASEFAEFTYSDMPTVTTDLDLTLNDVCPQEVPLPDHYPEWASKQATVTNPDGTEEIYWPIGIDGSIGENKDMTQEEAQSGEGTLELPEEDPDATTATDPAVDPDPTTGNDDPDTGTSTDPDSDWKPDGDIGHFTLDLTEYFPFCIPFDLYDFFACLNADPVAPVIDWVIPLPGGETYPLKIDLSEFDSVAQLLRRLQLLLFCTGLAFKTRDLIKG